MKLSLSVRVAEAACKTRLNVPFGDLVQLAKELGYSAVCMRASAAGVQTPSPKRLDMRKDVEDAGLFVSMVTADFDVPLNNAQGPNSLREIGPSLDVAEDFGCDLIRICMKSENDIEHAQRAADQAAERNIRLVHQCHTTSLFEEVEPSLKILEKIGRPNFGLIYEPANLMLCNQPYGEETLRKFLPYIMNVYVQNHAIDPAGPAELETWCLGPRRFRHIPIWEPGGVNFDDVIAGLKAVAYDGTFTIHQAFAELMGPREAAVESASYLRKFGCFDDPRN